MSSLPMDEVSCCVMILNFYLNICIYSISIRLEMMIVFCYFPELPEWSTANADDVEEVGTFDASGASMSLKVDQFCESAALC